MVRLSGAVEGKTALLVLSTVPSGTDRTPSRGLGNCVNLSCITESSFTPPAVFVEVRASGCFALSGCLKAEVTGGTERLPSCLPSVDGGAVGGWWTDEEPAAEVDGLGTRSVVTRDSVVCTLGLVLGLVTVVTTGVATGPGDVVCCGGVGSVVGNASRGKGPSDNRSLCVSLPWVT